MEFLSRVSLFLDKLSKWLKIVGSVEKGFAAMNEDLKSQIKQFADETKS